MPNKIAPGNNMSAAFQKAVLRKLQKIGSDIAKPWIIVSTAVFILFVGSVFYLARTVFPNRRHSAPHKAPRFANITAPETPPRPLDFLPASKTSAVRKVEVELQDELKRRITPGLQDSTGVGELAKMLKDQEVKLNKLLTSEEKLEYDLRYSIRAQMLKNVLSPMEPTESEFRNIFKFTKAFEDSKFDGVMAIEAAKALTEQKIRESLGETRFEKYRLVHDKDFIAIYVFFKDDGLLPDQLTELYRAWSRAGESADRIRLNTELSTEAKTQQLKALAQDTVEVMKQILGTGPGSERFNENGFQFPRRLESLEVRTKRAIEPFKLDSPGIFLFPP